MNKYKVLTYSREFEIVACRYYVQEKWVLFVVDDDDVTAQFDMEAILGIILTDRCVDLKS